MLEVMLKEEEEEKMSSVCKCIKQKNEKNVFFLFLQIDRFTVE